MLSDCDDFAALLHRADDPFMMRSTFAARRIRSLMRRAIDQFMREDMKWVSSLLTMCMLITCF